MWLRTLVVGLLVWAGATLLIDGWLRRPRGLSLYEHRAPFPAVVCGRRGADVAERQLTAERMGDGRAGSGRPLSWFGELAKRRTSRFGVVAALPSQLAASAAVGTEPTERDFHSCPLMLGLIGIGVFDLHPVRHLSSVRIWASSM